MCAMASSTWRPARSRRACTANTSVSTVGHVARQLSKLSATVSCRAAGAGAAAEAGGSPAAIRPGTSPSGAASRASSVSWTSCPLSTRATWGWCTPARLASSRWDQPAASRARRSVAPQSPAKADSDEGIEAGFIRLLLDIFKNIIRSDAQELSLRASTRNP